MKDNSGAYDWLKTAWKGADMIRPENHEDQCTFLLKTFNVETNETRSFCMERHDEDECVGARDPRCPLIAKELGGKTLKKLATKDEVLARCDDFAVLKERADGVVSPYEAERFAYSSAFRCIVMSLTDDQKLQDELLAYIRSYGKTTAKHGIWIGMMEFEEEL